MVGMHSRATQLSKNCAILPWRGRRVTQVCCVLPRKHDGIPYSFTVRDLP
jgi:hypothetical protein